MGAPPLNEVLTKRSTGEQLFPNCQTSFRQFIPSGLDLLEATAQRRVDCPKRRMGRPSNGNQPAVLLDEARPLEEGGR